MVNDDMTMKGSLGWKSGRDPYMKAMKEQGVAWAGPRCQNPAGCSVAQRCTMGGACEDMPRDADSDGGEPD